MTLLAFVPSIAPDIERTIQSKLTALEADYDVRVLFAIESGSSAWGFCSRTSERSLRAPPKSDLQAAVSAFQRSVE